jgi:hypothetical protein
MDTITSHPPADGDLCQSTIRALLGSWRNIPITLTTGVLSVNACFRQLSVTLDVPTRFGVKCD